MEKMFILLACATMFMLLLTVSYNLFRKVEMDNERDKAKAKLKENLDKLFEEIKKDLKEEDK